MEGEEKPGLRAHIHDHINFRSGIQKRLYAVLLLKCHGREKRRDMVL